MSSVLALFIAVAATHWCCCSCDAEPYYKEIYPPVNLTQAAMDGGHIFFALVQSFGSEFNGSGNVAGIKVALNRINSDPSILPDHTLHFTLTDSKCNRTIALDALFKQLLSEDNISKVAVLGCGCSVATEPTAEVSHYFNLTHISCSSASTELIDRFRFRSYFQLLQTMIDIADIYKGLIDHYSWKYVSLVVQNENLYTLPISSLKKYLEANEIGYSEMLFESDSSIGGLSQPIDPNARIFIVASYERHSRAFLCEAYKQGLSYPNYLFILMGWYNGKWWLRQSDDLECTPEQREMILSRALTVHHFNFYVPDDKQTTSGISGLQYKEEEDAIVRGPLMYNKIHFSPYCYDATWTLAYALNKTLQSFSSRDIQYHNNAFHNQMFRAVNSSNFNGITGPVKFSSEGIRTTNNRQVFQLQTNNTGGSLEVVQVGEVEEVNGTGEFGFNPFFPMEELWPAGEPRDGVAKNVTVSVHVGTTALFAVLATAGIVFTAICLAFNFYFRGKKLIKLSSPKLNYIIGVGALILYVDIYLLVVPTKDQLTVKVLCSLTPWLTAIGYSLCYGIIVAKMVRVYFIFNNPKPNSTTNLKDWKLAVGVMVLVLIDLSILVSYTVVEGLGGIQVISVVNKENPSRSEETFGVVAVHRHLICKSKGRDIFLGVLYGYKALLQVLALILTFTTRKVKVKGLNDALYIAAAIYITSLLWAIVIVSTYSLVEYLNVFTTVFCLGLFVGTSAIMTLVFIPKMIALYKDPEGDTIFTAETWNTNKGQESSPQRHDAEVSTLRRRVTELENTLAQLKN